MIDKNILLEEDYRTMFKNCVSISVSENEQDDVKVVEDIEFDGFDWDGNMKNAYSI